MRGERHYWIYEIECLESGKRYIGKTGKSNPCLRWAEHFLELNRGASCSSLLQEEWLRCPDATMWRFRVIRDVDGGAVAAHHAEAEETLMVPEELRLNTKGTSLIAAEKRRRVLELIAQGVRYVDIGREVGLAIGTISKIKNKYAI